MVQKVTDMAVRVIINWGGLHAGDSLWSNYPAMGAVRRLLLFVAEERECYTWKTHLQHSSRPQTSRARTTCKQEHKITFPDSLFQIVPQ